MECLGLVTCTFIKLIHVFRKVWVSAFWEKVEWHVDHLLVTRRDNLMGWNLVTHSLICFVIGFSLLQMFPLSFSRKYKFDILCINFTNIFHLPFLECLLICIPRKLVSFLYNYSTNRPDKKIIHFTNILLQISVFLINRHRNQIWPTGHTRSTPTIFPFFILHLYINIYRVSIKSIRN